MIIVSTSCGAMRIKLVSEEISDQWMALSNCSVRSATLLPVHTCSFFSYTDLSATSWTCQHTSASCFCTGCILCLKIVLKDICMTNSPTFLGLSQTPVSWWSLYRPPYLKLQINYFASHFQFILPTLLFLFSYSTSHLLNSMFFIDFVTLSGMWAP